MEAKDRIISQLKAASDDLDKQITSASGRLELGTVNRLQVARMKIQEAITKLLEVAR